MNLRTMTADDHRGMARRIRQIELMITPLVSELTQTYGASSRVGTVAARVLARAVLFELRSQLMETWHEEGHFHEGFSNPYEDRSPAWCGPFLPALSQGVPDAQQKMRGKCA